MATPPRSLADRSFNPPSSRPIGVRAPATITDPAIRPSKVESSPCERYPARPAQATFAGPPRLSNASQPLAGPAVVRHDGPMFPAGLITAVDHVGIAVADLDEAVAFYAENFGFEVVHEEVNQGQDVREAMLAVGDSRVCLQLLAPLGPNSVIRR